MIPRRNFVPRNYIYVFSYDADLEMRREEIGFVPGGLRVNVFAKPDETRVYHALGETTVLENKTLKGTVVWGGDWALVREDDIGLLDVKLTIQMDDPEKYRYGLPRRLSGRAARVPPAGHREAARGTERNRSRRLSTSRLRSTRHRQSTGG